MTKKDNKVLLEYARKREMDERSRRIIADFVKIACDSGTKDKADLRLAAIFDLLVSCQYYANLANKGWTYCGEGVPIMFYPYTNVCPRCIGNGNFVFSKANKPESGKIGQTTTGILCEMFLTLFKLKGRNVEVYKAAEPIDIIFYEPSTGIMVISEVKSAPLITIPLSVSCEEITEEIEGRLKQVSHCASDNPFIRSSRLSLFFPKTKNHAEKSFEIRADRNDEASFLEAALRLSMESKNFLTHYFSFWEEAYLAYCKKEKDNPIFWLTNGCGGPVPRPESWPHKPSGGLESVSDAKSSVGMDRTDDIKKGIYQVLKLGAEFKPEYEGIKTALISNIYAVRHAEEYLDSIKDIIWTIDRDRRVLSWSDLPEKAPLYNLFDGIIAFTGSDIRDPKVGELFNFGI